MSPTAATPTGFFSQRFEALFHAGTLRCSVCLTPQLFLAVYLHANVGLPTSPAAASPGPLAAALLRVLSTPAAHLGPSYQSD